MAWIMSSSVSMPLSGRAWNCAWPTRNVRAKSPVRPATPTKSTTTGPERAGPFGPTWMWEAVVGAFDGILNTRNVTENSLLTASTLTSTVPAAPVRTGGVSSPPDRVAVKVCAAAGTDSRQIRAAAPAHIPKNFLIVVSLVEGEGGEGAAGSRPVPAASRINGIRLILPAKAYGRRKPFRG